MRAAGLLAQVARRYSVVGQLCACFSDMSMLVGYAQEDYYWAMAPRKMDTATARAMAAQRKQITSICAECGKPVTGTALRRYHPACRERMRTRRRRARRKADADKLRKRRQRARAKG